MEGEYISIETLRIYQEIEKENKELQEKINKAIQYIKNNTWTDDYGHNVIEDDEEYLLKTLGDKNEQINNN